MSKYKALSTKVKNFFDLRSNFVNKHCIKFNIPLFEFQCNFQNIGCSNYNSHCLCYYNFSASLEVKAKAPESFILTPPEFFSLVQFQSDATSAYSTNKSCSSLAPLYAYSGPGLVEILMQERALSPMHLQCSCNCSFMHATVHSSVVQLPITLCIVLV